jgi:pimeloyl-ACP methyl ester carboxylesterase
MNTLSISCSHWLKSVVGWRDERQARVLIIAGEKDTLMGVGLMRKMAADYRQQFISFAKSLWGARLKETEETKPESSDRQGVGFEVIQGSGHHIQNDLHWEECAQKILAFVDQL